MPDFEFADDSPSPSRRSHPAPGPSWLHTFSATFAAVLLAGVVLLLGIRLYVHWSIAEWGEKWKNPPAAQET